jgi:hypothetical protein
LRCVWNHRFNYCIVRFGDSLQSVLKLYNLFLECPLHTAYTTLKLGGYNRYSTEEQGPSPENYCSLRDTNHRSISFRRLFCDNDNAVWLPSLALQSGNHCHRLNAVFNLTVDRHSLLPLQLYHTVQVKKVFPFRKLFNTRHINIYEIKPVGLTDWSCRWGESLNCGHQGAYCSLPRLFFLKVWSMNHWWSAPVRQVDSFERKRIAKIVWDTELMEKIHPYMSVPILSLLVDSTESRRISYFHNFLSFSYYFRKYFTLMYRKTFGYGNLHHQHNVSPIRLRALLDAEKFMKAVRVCADR